MHSMVMYSKGMSFHIEFLRVFHFICKHRRWGGAGRGRVIDFTHATRTTKIYCPFLTIYVQFSYYYLYI